MKNYDDDSKFAGVINDLKKLDKIEAPENFEKVLFEKLSQTPEKEKISFIDRIFTPARLLPTAGFAVVIIILFSLTNIFVPVSEENPLLANPRVRDDVIAVTNNNTPSKVENNKPKASNDVFATTEENKNNLNNDLNNDSVNDPNLGIRVTGAPSINNGYYNRSILTSVSPNGSIDKNGLDYKQIYLQRLQRAQIEQLRKKMEEMQKNNR